MANEKSVPRSPDDLALARARIIELEAQLQWAQAHGEDHFTQSPRSILESITDAFVALDRDFRYVWINVEAARLLGCASDSLLGRCPWEVFPEIGGTTFEQKCREALQQQKSLEFEHFVVRSNRWFYNKAYPTKEGGLAIYWREITDQKRADGELRRQVLVLEQVHDSIIATDLEGKITRWNHGAQRLFGYEAHEVLGKHIEILFFEAQEDVNARIVQPLLRDGGMELERRARHKLGSECFVRLSLSLLRDEAQKVYGMLGVALDITKQTHAEQAVRDSEERYRELANTLPHVFFTTDPLGRCKMVTRHWEEYSGTPAEQSLELNWLALIHPNDVPAHTAHWNECLRTGQLFELEYRLRNAEGEYRWHLVRAVPVRGNQGEINEWVGSATDIHKRKSVEQDLRSSEELFRLASQAVEGILYDWNPQTGVVRRSGNLQQLIGIPIEEAEASANWWQERVHPADRSAASLSVLSALDKSHNKYETEFRFRHADGRWVYLSDRAFIVRDERGMAIRVVGSTHDVTQQKHLEQELKERNKQLKFQADILEATHDAVVALDANLCIRYCNAAAEKLYGVRLADVLGQSLSALHDYAWLAPEDEQRSLTNLRDRGSWKGEYIHILRDGTQLVVYCTVNVLAPEAGGGMVSVIRDITQRKRSELDAKDQTLRLERANEDLLHFAYAVSHDLQAPLRTITSFSQLLGLKYKQKLEGQGVEFIRWIIDASTRMDTMLHDLLQFAKVAGGNAEFSEDVSLADAFSTALEGLRSGVEETQAVITTDKLPTVTGETGQMVQLFQNLIGNSLKYRKPDTPPQIHVSARDSDNEWVITVRDNGIGFEPKHAEQIFGVFQRLHGKEVAGTGIGLTICKRIVERRGGKIWAEAQPGAGATFHFSIPHSTAALRGAPSMDWERVHTVLESRPQPDETPIPMAHFDELFKTLDLAQAIVRNLDGTILIWTKGAERLFGWTEAEAQGQKLHDLIATEFPKSRAAVEGALLRAGEWTGELKACKKDGRAVWLASHNVLYRDGSGRPQSVIEVHNDITALKQAEAALTRSSEQRDLALGAGRMGVWSWDKRTNRIEWSQTIESFLGMAPGSFEGTMEAFQQRLHPDDSERLQQRITAAFENGPDYAVENRMLREDGTYCWVRGQGRVVYDEQNQPVGLMGVVWDISDSKQNEADRQFL